MCCLTNHSALLYLPGWMGVARKVQGIILLLKPCSPKWWHHVSDWYMMPSSACVYSNSLTGIRFRTPGLKSQVFSVGDSDLDSHGHKPVHTSTCPHQWPTVNRVPLCVKVNKKVNRLLNWITVQNHIHHIQGGVVLWSSGSLIAAALLFTIRLSELHWRLNHQHY